MLGYTPPGQTLPCADTYPWADTPMGRHPHGRQTPAQCMLGYTAPCPVHAGIHTPCPVHAGIHTPPCQVHAGIHPPEATAADGRHPTGMYSCLERTSPTRLLPSGEYNYGYKLFNSFSRKKSK